MPVPVPPMPNPVVEHGPSVDGDQTPFEQIADVEPIGEPEVHVRVAVVPPLKGPNELPVE